MRKWGLLAIPIAGVAIVAAGLYFKRSDAAPANTYVDAAQCALCHSQVATAYRRSGMARSFYRPQSEHLVEDLNHKAPDTHFAMLNRDGRYYQRWQTGYDGKETPPAGQSRGADPQRPGAPCRGPSARPHIERPGGIRQGGSKDSRFGSATAPARA